MLRVFLDEQRHEVGRDREIESMYAVIYTEKCCNCFLHVSFHI